MSTGAVPRIAEGRGGRALPTGAVRGGRALPTGAVAAHCRRARWPRLAHVDGRGRRG